MSENLRQREREFQTNNKERVFKTKRDKERGNLRERES